MNRNSYIIYLAVGRQVREQMICSALSLQRVLGNSYVPSIVIYSDEIFEIPRTVQSLSPEFVLIGQERLARWMSEASGNFFNVKINVIADFASGHRGNVLFVDADTFFRRDPERIFSDIEAGKFVMHLREQKLSERPALLDYILNREIAGLASSMDMWNSGVIGFNTECGQMLRKVSELALSIFNDRGYPANERHIIEQLAFSVYFQEHQLVPADAMVIHYWFCKDLTSALMRCLLECDGKFGSSEDLFNLMLKFIERRSNVPKHYLDYLPAETVIGQALRRIIFKQTINYGKSIKPGIK